MCDIIQSKLTKYHTCILSIPNYNIIALQCVAEQYTWRNLAGGKIMVVQNGRSKTGQAKELNRDVRFRVAVPVAIARLVWVTGTRKPPHVT